MTDNDLQSAAAQICDDLLAIAQLFAKAGRYHVAVQTQGFARLIVEEAASAGSVGNAKDCVEIETTASKQGSH